MLQRRPVLVIPALLFLLVALGVGFGFGMAKALITVNKQHQENVALEGEIHEIQIKNQRELRALRALDERAGIEHTARRYGYTYPTEYRLNVPD